MGAPFYDITLYASTPFEVGSPEYYEHTFIKNYICDLYVQKMYGYKPPKTTRITIEPSYYNIWKQTWRYGSLVTIAVFYSYEEYKILDKKARYKYILDIIQTATLQLSEEYNWDKNVFIKAYNEIINCDFEFKVTYPFKMSKNRKKSVQVVIEKDEYVTSFILVVKMNDTTKAVTLFQNRNWFLYDIIYEMAKNTKWMDDDTIGIFSIKRDKSCYYSITKNTLSGNLNFKEDDFNS